MESSGSLLVVCENKEQRDRIVWFLSGATRPSFEEEAGEHADCVELFEVAAVPDLVTTPSATEVYASFNMFDNFDNVESTAAAVACLKPRGAFIYYYDTDGVSEFFHCEDYGLSELGEAPNPDQGNEEEGEEAQEFNDLEALREVARQFFEEAD